MLLKDLVSSRSGYLSFFLLIITHKIRSLILVFLAPLQGTFLGRNNEVIGLATGRLRTSNRACFTADG